MFLGIARGPWSHHETFQVLLRNVAAAHAYQAAYDIAAAHLGGFGMWDETEETLVGEDVVLDLSHTFFWMPHERIGRIIRNHSARRILFGTDSPWQEQSRILGAFAELPLSESDRRAICCENAMMLFNIKI